MSDVVTFEKQGQIGFITLNRPEARNAVNGAVAQAFETALDQLENDPEVSTHWPLQLGFYNREKKLIRDVSKHTERTTKFNASQIKRVS